VESGLPAATSEQQPVVEEDPFPDLTDDDIRRGFETLLGNVPRASHPSVQQLGFRGYFKQKVEEMNKRDLFPIASTAAQKEKEAERNSNIKESFPTSEGNVTRARLTGARNEGGGQRKDAGEKRKAKIGRQQKEAVDGKLIRLSDKEEIWEPPLSPVHGKRREKRHQSEKGSDAIKVEGFIRDLLARWEEVSVRDARRAFVELNGWEPNEALLGRGSADLKGWYRGKFEGMVQKGRRYVRNAVNKYPWHMYRWERWGKAQFSENVKSSAWGESAQYYEGMKQFDPATQEKLGAFREESVVDANAGVPEKRKRAPQEGTLVGCKRRKTAEGAEVRGKVAAMRGSEARCPSVGAGRRMTSADPNVTSEDPAAGVIRGLLRRWAAADLEEIARVFAQLNGWSPSESHISRSNQDAKSWYDERFREMAESGKRLIRLDKEQGEEPRTPGACLPAGYCYRHWTEVGENAHAASGAPEKSLQILPSLEEAHENGGRVDKGMGWEKSAREETVGSLVTKGTAGEESEPDAHMEKEEKDASHFRRSSGCEPAGVFSVAESGGNGYSEEGVSEKPEQRNDAAMAGSARAALQDAQEESIARAARWVAFKVAGEKKVGLVALKAVSNVRRRLFVSQCKITLVFCDFRLLKSKAVVVFEASSESGRSFVCEGSHYRYIWRSWPRKLERG
jgi:hypothetical protein